MALSDEERALPSPQKEGAKPMSNANDTNKVVAEDILKADFKYFAEAFWKNESGGETRVQFFITLVTAVISALVALATAVEVTFESGNPAEPGATSWIDLGKITWIAVFALGSLLLLGLTTFFRIVRRNCVTDEYKAASDYIRRTYALPVLQTYDPFRKPTSKKPWFGGLAHLVAVLNSIILGALFFMLTIQPSKDGYLMPPDEAFGAGAILALVAAAMQIAWAEERRDDYKKALDVTFGLKKGS